MVGATSQTEASVSQHIAVGRLRSGVSLGTFSAADGHRLQFKIYLHCCAEAWWLASSSGSKPFIPTSQSSQRSLYLEQINKTNADRDAIFSPSDHAMESQDVSQLAMYRMKSIISIHIGRKEARASSNSLMMNQQELLLIKEAFVHRK